MDIEEKLCKGIVFILDLRSNELNISHYLFETTNGWCFSDNWLYDNEVIKTETLTTKLVWNEKTLSES